MCVIRCWGFRIAGVAVAGVGRAARAVPILRGMRVSVLAAVVLGGLGLGGPAWAWAPRCCIERQPLASRARRVDCGQTVSGCGKTFECRCLTPSESTPEKAKRRVR